MPDQIDFVEDVAIDFEPEIDFQPESKPAFDISKDVARTGEEVAYQNLQKAKEVGLGVTEAPAVIQTPKALFKEAMAPTIEVGKALGISPQTLADAADTIYAYRGLAGMGEFDWEKAKQALGEMPTRAPSGVEKVAAGTQQAVVNAMDFFTSPVGVATLGSGALPQTAQKIIAGAFTVSMARQVPEQIVELSEAVKSQEPERIARAATGLGLNAAFITQGVKTVSKPFAPEPIVEQARQANAPATAAALEQVLPAKEPAVSEQAPPPKEAPEAAGEVKMAAAEAPAVAPQPEVTPEVTPPQAQLGIMPPGAGVVSSIGKSLQRAWTGLRTAVATSPNKEAMAAHMDAADNSAMLSGGQMGKRVELAAPDKLDRQAITFIVEALGDPSGNPIAALNDYLPKATGKNLEATKAIQHAIDNFSRLEPAAQEVSKIMDAQRDFEQMHGVDTDNVEGYIKHAYDTDLMMGKSRPVILSSSSGGGVGSAFKKQRVFQTYADAIEAGLTPKNLDAAALVNSRVTAGTRLVNRLEWGNALRQVADPTSNKPIVENLIKQPKGTEVAPAGYTTNEIIPGVRVAVHEGYEAIFDALKGRSRLAELEIKGIPIGRISLKTEGAIKHGLLAFDTFHASRIMQKQMFLTARLPSWTKGKTLLDYSPKDLGEAVKQGLITQEMADYAVANKPTADLLIKEGLNVGKVQEALYADVVRKLPIVGRFNKWVFDKVTRGAMMESGIVEFQRIKNQNPQLSDSQVARKVARDLNFYFGNISRQGILKSPTLQDLSRLVALAPQWVESMVQTEARGFGQLAKAPIDSARAGQLRTGTLAKGVGQGLLAYFLATQLLNLATRKQFTWQNEEKDHKLDAWIPDVTGKSDGFFISPFSVAAEVTHDFIRYGARKDTEFDVASQIIKNKLSPLARAGSVLFRGEDYSGTKILGTWNRVKEAAWALAPTPIPLQAPIRGSEYPGQAQRQAFGSAGLKIEPAHREVPYIVEKHKITSRAGFEEYLNAVAKEARRLPADERIPFAFDRLSEDEIAPKYMDEARSKLKYKLRE